MEKSVEWYACHKNGEDVAGCMDRQIDEFFAG
jgi:hypothetical protein